MMSEIQSVEAERSLRDHFLIPGRVVIAFDATKDRSELEFRKTLNSIKSHEDVLRSGDTLVFLGVLHKIQHPLGYQMKATIGDFLGTTQIRSVKEEVSKKVDLYVKMLQPLAQECEEEGINIEVKISAGTPTRKVVVQELVLSNATWLVLDRHLRKDSKYYLEQIPCKIAFVQKDLTMEVVRSYHNTEKHDNNDNIDHELLFSMSKCVDSTDKTDSSVSTGSSPSSEHKLSPNQSNQDISGKLKKEETTILNHSPNKSPFCCGIKTEQHMNNSTSFKYSEIRSATDDFSKENIIGEGGYGVVYKGKLKSNGQLIAAKVRKDSSFQGYAEFHSEIHVLNLASHKNIVMLLGYCIKEKLNILVYEYVCNKSLEWHLFENKESKLEWHRRYDIAIGTAKGLRYLHEECRESPIIHRDMRPSNILLTHHFVPVEILLYRLFNEKFNLHPIKTRHMLGDFGLAKWTTDEDNVHTTVVGTIGYLSPEYAENGKASIKTDVYSFGIVLIQLISGRKVVFDSDKVGHQHSLKQWAVPLIQKLALQEIMDHRIRDSCDMSQLQNMAKVAYLCVHTIPELRPSMGQVLRFLEGENDHLSVQFMLLAGFAVSEEFSLRRNS